MCIFKKKTLQAFEWMDSIFFSFAAMTVVQGKNENEKKIFNRRTLRWIKSNWGEGRFYELLVFVVLILVVVCTTYPKSVLNNSEEKHIFISLFVN